MESVKHPRSRLLLTTLRIVVCTLHYKEFSWTFWKASHRFFSNSFCNLGFYCDGGHNSLKQIVI